MLVANLVASFGSAVEMPLVYLCGLFTSCIKRRQKNRWRYLQFSSIDGRHRMWLESSAAAFVGVRPRDIEWVVVRLIWALALLMPQVTAAEPTGLERDVRALLRPASLGGFVLALGAAGVAHRFDGELNGPVDNELIEPVLDFGNFYFETEYSVVSVAGVWAMSKVAGWKETGVASGEVLRALVLANAMVAPLKVTVGRTRPDRTNDWSFPSGHSANAFAMSTVLSRRYGRWVGIPLCALAATVPVARIHGQHHFFSDVVAGAILGVVAGLAVDQHEDKAWGLVPAYTGGTWTVQAWRRY